MIKKQAFLAQDQKQKRTLIIGAGDAGARLVQQMRQSTDLAYNPIGFIEDNLKKQNMEILGVPVLGKRSDLHHLVDLYQITDIIIAMPSVDKAEITEIVHLCKKASVNIKIVPSVKHFIQGDISIKEIREINIKDLLGRETIQPTKRLEEYLRYKTILITGAGGSIGSELANQVAGWEPECLILMGHGENSIFNVGMMIKDRFPAIRLELVITDIQDQHLIEQTFKKYRPQIVFHAAAHKHVPLMETSEGSAVRNNIFGTKHVAEASHRFQVERFVLISTDKAVHPINMMGMTKRIGEMIVQALSQGSSTKFSIVRFGNVLESRGSVIPIFRKQIETGGPVTVTHPDMVRYFMTIPEAVQLVLEAGALSKGGEVFVLDMGEPLKIAELAKKMIRLYGYEPDREIQIIYTGIRPGEKLNESLFYEFENVKPTDHPYVVIAVPTKSMNTNLQQDLVELEDALIHRPEKLRGILSTMIQKDVHD
jgi:FlaA1/EpsC-like NDP-sugar epimerase